VERLKSGNFYGTPIAFVVDGKVTATDPQAVWDEFRQFERPVRERRERQTALGRDDIGAVSRKMKGARLDMAQAKISYGADSAEFEEAKKNFEEVEEWGTTETGRITKEIVSLSKENDRYQLRMVTADGTEMLLPLSQIVRAFPANQLDLWGKIEVYGSRWWEFVADDPRESNTAGGVFPAIWGTVVMTLLMSLAVVPFGVLAALYLREYAKSGPIISAVRIAINNLAGVPSIVFGVFGLGFFCYLVGAFIDGGPKQIQVEPLPPMSWWLGVGAVTIIGPAAFLLSLAGRGARRLLYLLTHIPWFHGFYQAELPNPTFGTGGLLWAALTLALLTLPVVIVATEEALASVPNSMREGSYACGASKWQTIWRIVLPRALPGIMTGMILAMARGAGEVAPLMLVGAQQHAPMLPMDGVFPYLHPTRSFMHLGYHIFEVGFHSPDSEAGRPMVYTTTLLLIAIVALLNLAAVWLRSKLRQRYHVSNF
jgi:phosphate transport system permease protein